MDGKKLLTVSQLAEEYPAFSEKLIRWWIYNEKTNGLSASIVRIGRRIFINQVEFETWLKSHCPPSDVLRIDE